MQYFMVIMHYDPSSHAYTMHWPSRNNRTGPAPSGTRPGTDPGEGVPGSEPGGSNRARHPAVPLPYRKIYIRTGMHLRVGIFKAVLPAVRYGTECSILMAVDILCWDQLALRVFMCGPPFSYIASPSAAFILSPRFFFAVPFRKGFISSSCSLTRENPARRCSIRGHDKRLSICGRDRSSWFEAMRCWN